MDDPWTHLFEKLHPSFQKPLGNSPEQGNRQGVTGEHTVCLKYLDT